MNISHKLFQFQCKVGNVIYSVSENIVKLAGIGFNFAVKSLFKAIYTVVFMRFVIPIGNTAKIICMATALNCVLNLRSLHKIIRHKFSVFV